MFPPPDTNSFRKMSGDCVECDTNDIWEDSSLGCSDMADMVNILLNQTKELVTNIICECTKTLDKKEYGDQMRVAPNLCKTYNILYIRLVRNCTFLA